MTITANKKLGTSSRRNPGAEDGIAKRLRAKETDGEHGNCIRRAFLTARVGQDIAQRGRRAVVSDGNGKIVFEIMIWGKETTLAVSPEHEIFQFFLFILIEVKQPEP